MQHAEQAKAVLHLGQAIDAQTKGDEAGAANELERALEAGFDHAAKTGCFPLNQETDGSLEVLMPPVQKQLSWSARRSLKPPWLTLGSVST
jgi:hypothetical protein